MAGRRQFIFDLPKKLDVLREATESRNWAELEDLSGISKSALDAVRNRNHEAYSRLGTEHQRQLADAFDFLVSLPQWRAHDRGEKDEEPGPDTAEAFRTEYRRVSRKIRKVAKATVKTLDPEPASVVPTIRPSADAVPASTAHSRDVRDATVELVAGKRRPASSPLGTMAQLSLSLGQPAGAGAQQILVEVSCHKGSIIGSNRHFSIRRALLSLDCGEARGRRAAVAGTNGLPVELRNSYGKTLLVWSGTYQLMRWEVVAGGALIGHLEFDAGVVEGLSAGDVLRVSLSAWLKHVNTDELDEHPTFGVIDAAGKSMDLPKEAMTVEQRRIVEHVNKLRLKCDENCHAEVAAAELELVRKT